MPKLPKWADRKLEYAADRSKMLLKDPSTEFLPQLNQWTTQGLTNRADIASSGNTVAGAGASEAQKILSGGYLDVTKDPNYQRAINEALGATTDRFAGSGRVGSGAYAGALADAATGTAAQMYDRERGRQVGVLGMLPQVAASQYLDTGMLEDSGRALDEDAMARFDWPYGRLDRFANTLYGNPAAQTPGTANTQKFDVWSALSGALAPR